MRAAGNSSRSRSSSAPRHHRRNIYTRRRTSGTCWGLNRVTAVVAFQALAALVIGERDAAILTLHERAATAAESRPGIAAAVDRPEPACRSSRRSLQWPRGASPKLESARCVCEIPRADPRCRTFASGAIFHARGSSSSLYFPARRYGRFPARRGRAEQHARAFELARARRPRRGRCNAAFLPACSCFLLLVHDDRGRVFRAARIRRSACPPPRRASPWRTRHHSRARSHVGEARCAGWRRDRAESRAELAGHPRRERDFGHQQQCAASRRASVFDRRADTLRSCRCRSRRAATGRQIRPARNTRGFV